MMVCRLFLKVPYYMFRVYRCGKNEKINYEESYRIIQHVTKVANRAGRVTVKAYGLENIPEKNGFIFFPNHQGLYDVLTVLDSCPVPFAFVIKKEMKNVILLKQVIEALGSICIDRENIKQSMEVIRQVASEVEGGRNFLIFPEGTRSKNGNTLLEFKGGSFKSAVKAKCPIVPCALIDSYIPFDEKSLAPVTVKAVYLPPLYYEEYKDMKTVEIARTVKERIEEAIKEHTNKT